TFGTDDTKVCNRQSNRRIGGAAASMFPCEARLGGPFASGRMIMFRMPFVIWRSALAMTVAAAMTATALAIMGGDAISADKYKVKVPDGLASSEFKGFEDWAAVGVSQARDLIEVIVANPVMIKAYRAGVPGNGKPFPDGSKMAKIHWTTKKGTEPGNT